jgi:capsular exopolysaccharide synthesis family protein
LKRQREEVKSEAALFRQRQAHLLAERKLHEKRVDRAPEVEQELLILERDYENMRNNYRALLDKRLNASVVENLEKRQKGAQFRILDAANFPTKPEKPNQPRILIFGLMAGLATGLGLAVLRERVHPPFRRPEEVELLFGPQLLAIIPDFSLERDRVRWYNRIGWRPMLPKNGATLNPEGGAQTLSPAAGGGTPPRRLPEDNFIVKLLPSSTVAEQYRVAATRLSLAKTGGQSAVVAITSAIKGEGKTTTVVNLGYTMARDLGKRTLLLDCDFTCPRLHLYTDTLPRYGLADCLVGEVWLDDCLAGYPEAPCSIMPVGNASVRSTELLKSARLAGILAQLRERFEYIFINTPPILPMAAMNILATHADMLVVVVKGNSTPKQVVQRALASLPRDAPAYAILNAVENQILTSYMGSYEYLAH